jgi:hypothetical protein
MITIIQQMKEDERMKSLAILDRMADEIQRTLNKARLDLLLNEKPSYLDKFERRLLKGARYHIADHTAFKTMCGMPADKTNKPEALWEGLKDGEFCPVCDGEMKAIINGERGNDPMVFFDFWQLK